MRRTPENYEQKKGSGLLDSGFCRLAAPLLACDRPWEVDHGDDEETRDVAMVRRCLAEGDERW